MRKFVIGAVAVAVVGAGGAAAFLGMREFPRHAAAADAPAPAAAGIPVTPGTVVAADVPVFLTGIGSVQAYNMVTIKSRVDGQITAVNFAEGQEVKAGDPLLQIDARPYQALLEQVQANKAKDEAQLVSAEADLARYTSLVGSGYQTRQSFDQQKALVGQLQASIKADQAQIDAAQLNITYSDIRAPISGRLGMRLVDIGNIVHAADTSGLVTITQTKPIFVSFTLSQENLHKIHEKQALAPLVTLAYGGDQVTRLSEGKLAVIDNAIDQTTGTIRLKASFANEDERLWPGEFVNVRLILSIRKDVPTVPSQTVQVGPNGNYVYVITSEQKVERRPVEVAAVQDGIAVVTKGLSPGEKVVVDGQYRLTEGARVRLEEPKAGPAG